MRSFLLGLAHVGILVAVFILGMFFASMDIREVQTVTMTPHYYGARPCVLLTFRHEEVVKELQKEFPDLEVGDMIIAHECYRTL